MKSAPLNSDLEVIYQPPVSPSALLEENREESLVDRLRLLLVHRNFLARFVALGLGIALLVAFLIPSRYESSVRLMPPDDQASSGMAMLAGLAGRMDGLGMLAGDFLGVKSSGGLFIGILTSRTVQDDLIRKYDLRRVYWTRRWDTARRKLAANTAIGEDRKSGIITIVVSDRDPHRAAQLAGEYVSELNAIVNQVSTSSARREREFLEGRLKDVRQDLETAEQEFGDFSSKNTAVDIKEQAKAMMTTAAAVQGQLIASRSQLEGLRQIYSDDHVRVRALRAHIAELEAQLTKLGGKYENPNDPPKNEEDALYPPIRRLPVLGIAYADLYRRTKVQEAIFETLTQQYELAKVAEAKEIPSVKLLDPPDVPEHRVGPSRVWIVFLGLFLSFAFGSLWILGRDQWRRIDPASPAKALLVESFDIFRNALPGGVRTRILHRWN
ncbi:MAG TPA: GNVR domain-containing protein [Verrucomicrobiae bacterium]|nr:GNVR domain-containing protein [Verrucomicrobiae bacterium]